MGGWIMCLLRFFKYCANYPIILTLVPLGDFLNILIIRLADALCTCAIC